jgi:hypothetical protein
MFGGGMEIFGAVFGLTALNVLAALLLIPLPLILPLTLAAIAEIYDEIGH